MAVTDDLLPQRFYIENRERNRKRNKNPPGPRLPSALGDSHMCAPKSRRTQNYLNSSVIPNPPILQVEIELEFHGMRPHAYNVHFVQGLVFDPHVDDVLRENVALE